LHPFFETHFFLNKLHLFLFTTKYLCCFKVTIWHIFLNLYEWDWPFHLHHAILFWHFFPMQICSFLQHCVLDLLFLYFCNWHLYENVLQCSLPNHLQFLNCFLHFFPAHLLSTWQHLLLKHFPFPNLANLQRTFLLWQTSFPILLHLGLEDLHLSLIHIVEVAQALLILQFFLVLTQDFLNLLYLQITDPVK